MRFTLLPPEIYLIVSSYLRLPDLNNLGQTSQQFHAFVEDLIYAKAIEEDKLYRDAPVSLAIAAIKGNLRAFGILLAKSDVDVIAKRISLNCHCHLERWKSVALNTPGHHLWQIKTSLLNILCDIRNQEMIKLTLAKCGSYEKAVSGVFRQHDGPSDDTISYTPLLHAAEIGNLSAMKLFVGAGADIFEKQEPWLESQVPNLSIIHGHAAVVEFLICSGVKFNRYHFIEAARRGHISVAKLLLDRGANRQWLDPALAEVCYHSDHTSMAKFLIKKGARAQAIDLTRVPRRALGSSARLILGQKPHWVNKEDVNGLTPLDTVCHGNLRGHAMKHFVLCLIEAGAEVKRSRDAQSTLHKAIQSENMEVVKALLGLKSQRHLLSTMDGSGFEALHRIFGLPLPKYRIISWWLLDAGFDMQSRNDEGQTLLHLSAFAGAPGIVRRILQAGVVDVSCRDNKGYTPLHCAVLAGGQRAKNLVEYMGTVRSILSGEIGTAEDLRNSTTEHTEYVEEVIRLLVAAGADVSPKTNFRKSPLDLVREYALNKAAFSGEKISF